MTEKPPRPSAGPPPLPKPRSHPPSTEEKEKESTAPRASPPPLRRGSKNSDEDQTKHFANLPTEAELVVIEGEFKGKVTKLGAGTVVIGRSSECDVILKSASGVSRKHCKVQFLGNRYVVVDLESRNGTIVNGTSVERKVLENGDKIEVGDEVLQFVQHSLDDVRGVDALEVSEVSISQFETAIMPQAPARPPRANPSILPETLPPTRAPAASTPPSQPPQLTPVSTLSPPPLPPPPPKERGRGSVALFAGLVGVVFAGGGFLVYDAFLRAPGHVAPAADAGAVVVDAGRNVVVVDAGAVPAAAVVVDAGRNVVVDAGANVADAGVAAAVDAGVAVADAGVAAAAAAVVDAGAFDPSQVLLVRAKVSGRCESVSVNVGDVVDEKRELLIVQPESFNLRKKLETLKREAAEFEGVAAGADELASIQREMRSIEARLKPQPLVSGKAGRVVEILVRPGDIVRDGVPVVKLAP